VHTFPKNRTEQRTPQQSEFSHGELQSTNNCLPASMSSKRLTPWWPWEILKQKYLLASACSLCTWPHIHTVALP